MAGDASRSSPITSEAKDARKLEFGWLESCAIVVIGLSIPLAVIPFVNVYAVPLSAFATICAALAVVAGFAKDGRSMVRRFAVLAFCVLILYGSHVSASNWPQGYRGVVPEALWRPLGIDVD